MRKTVCSFPFPYKRGVWLDFQTKEKSVKIPPLEDLEQDFIYHFYLYDYGREDLYFDRLIEINLLDLIFDEIGVNKFLLMNKKARKTLLHLMFLQVGGFNPYDFQCTPRFSQYTTESIAKNLKDAREYNQSISRKKRLLKKSSSKEEVCESPQDMLKLLLKNFSFETALQLWTCYKYLRWSTDHQNILWIFNFSDVNKMQDPKLYTKILKYLYLFYSIIDESLVMKCIFKEFDLDEGLNILTICLEQGNLPSDFLALKLLLSKFYSVLFRFFNFQAL